MATYLQGVTDYIPQFQPFQPDLNFYANVMQTKQTQYDTNWKALNKMYSQYYYADLTRDGNIKKKDEYLNNIEFNLKRVSQLDLSLEQNVAQATQVFKPFYEDKGLMKDMAWTKNYNNQLNRAEIFRNSNETEQRTQYWEEGVRGMNYLRDEFKEATDEDAMGFQNAEYVPNVDVLGKAEKIAKDSGLSIEKVDFSDGGKFIVKTKNGEALTEPLQKLFEARLGSDPSIQSKYKMQAYVDRKDYAYSNAAQFGGDKNAAEMKYLENSFNVLKAQSDARYKQLQVNSSVYDNQIKDIQKQIDNGTASPTAKMMLEQYKMNKDINDKVLARAENENKMLNDGKNKTPLTSTGFTNPYGDLKSLRYKVDNGMASLLMQKDLDEAANIYAYRDMEIDVEANPYKILEEKQRNSMQLIAAREAASMRLAEFKSNLQKQKDYEDNIIENGAGYRDEKGNIQLYEDQNIVTTEEEKSGGVTGSINFKNKSRDISQMTKQEFLDPYFQSTFAVLDQAIADKKMSKQEAGKILGYNKNQGISLDDFIKKYNTYGDSWLRKQVGSKGVREIRNKMNEWIGNNRDLDLFTQNGEKTALYKTYREANMKMNDYMLYIKSDEKWKKETSKSVITDLTRQGYDKAKYLYDDNGNKRTEKEYIRALLDNKAISKDEMAEYIAQEKIQKGEAGYKAAVELIGMNDYWTAKGAQFLDVLDRVNKFLKPIAAPKQYIAEKIYGVATTPSVNFDYDELVKAAGKAYSTEKVIKTPPPRIPGGPTGSGTGLFATGSSRITVNPKVHGVGYAHFADVSNDLKTFGMDNMDRVSFYGISKDMYDKSGNKHNDVGKAALDKIREDMQKKKSSLGAFELKVSPIAGGSDRMAAVRIIPNLEWIKANTAKLNSKGGISEPGLFTPNEAAAIAKHGITYFMNNKKMNSNMYKQSYQSPMESYVETFGKYELNSIGGDPMKSFKVEKNTLGTGDYITTVTYPLFNPDTGKLEKQVYRNNVGFTGQNLENLRDGMIYNFMDDADIQNTLQYNNFENLGQ
jgi:hypothetical protein